MKVKCDFCGGELVLKTKFEDGAILGSKYKGRQVGLFVCSGCGAHEKADMGVSV